MGKDMIYLEMWFCCFCIVEVYAEVWSLVEVPEGIECIFEVVWTMFVVVGQ